MLKIGELSKISNVTVKAIRFYESKKLLYPAEVDRWTGYRYYDESSLERLSQITYLKQLGFSLKEIAQFDETTIKNKTKQIEDQIAQLSNNIKALSSFKKDNKGEYIMKNFVNDERVIGKWEKVGEVKQIGDFEKGKLFKDARFGADTIYFLPNGEEYWVFSWTKGKLYLKDKELLYEIIDGLMFLKVTEPHGKDGYFVVLKQVDKKAYKKQEIKITDNIDIEYVPDKKVVGLWEVVNWVDNKEHIDLEKKKECFLKSLTFKSNGEVIIETTNFANTLKYSKGVIIDTPDETLMEYTFKKVDGVEYMVLEWKSGDYTYGGQINCYYILKRA